MKKTIGKAALTLVAAIVMILLVAVLMAVPAFASESDMTTQNNEQFEIVDPKYEGDANNYVILPEAPEKEGYIFQGWSVDGSTKLYDAGEKIANSDGDKMQIKPVYEAIGAANERLEETSATLKNWIVIGLVMLVGGYALSCFVHDDLTIVGMFGGLFTTASLFLYILVVLAKS